MKYCPYCGADLIEDAVSFVLNAESNSLPANHKKKNQRKSQRSRKLQKRRKRNLLRSWRAALRTKPL